VCSAAASELAATLRERVVCHSCHHEIVGPQNWLLIYRVLPIRLIDRSIGDAK